MSRTLVIFKPDALRRGLVGTILARFEARGLALAALEYRTLPRPVVRSHYAEHQGKPFFEDLVSFLAGGPVVVGVLEGRGDVVNMVRTMMGATDPAKSDPGTIRGDLAMLIGENLIHGSDSEESASREIELFFPGMDSE